MKRLATAIGILVPTLLAAPAFAYGDGDPWLWHPLRASATEFGDTIDRLYWMIFWITGIIFIAVQVVLVWFLIRYRAVPGGKPKFIHGNTRLEMAWTITPAVILIGIAGLSKGAWDTVRVNMPTGDDVVYIECIAQQFDWFFRYPGNDGRFGRRDTIRLANARARGDTGDPWALDVEHVPANWDGEHPPGADDVLLQSEFRVPADRPVRIVLTSNDVLHSFFVPELRVKHDAVPGMNGGLLWFKVPWERARGHGPYDLICAELCGVNHYSMRGTMIVMRSGPVHPEALALSAEEWMARRDEDELALMEWLDEQTWETWVHVMSKIALAENTLEDDDFYY